MNPVTLEAKNDSQSLILSLVNSKFKENCRLMRKRKTRSPHLPAILLREPEPASRASTQQSRLVTSLTDNERVAFNFSCMLQPKVKDLSENILRRNLSSVVAACHHPHMSMDVDKGTKLPNQRLSCVKLPLLRNFSDFCSYNEKANFKFNNVVEHRFSYVLKLPKLIPFVADDFEETECLALVKSEYCHLAQANLKVAGNNLGDDAKKMKSSKISLFSFDKALGGAQGLSRSSMTDFDAQSKLIEMNENELSRPKSAPKRKAKRQKVNKWMKLINRLCTATLESVNL